MTFDEYMNSKKYRERILELLTASRANLSQRSFEMMAAPLNRELKLIDDQLNDYVDILLNCSSQSIVVEALIDNIDRHSSMIVKGHGAEIFFNTPFRVAPHANTQSFWSIDKSASQLTMWRESLPDRLAKPFSGQRCLPVAV
jgi:hypothetical protein